MRRGLIRLLAACCLLGVPGCGERAAVPAAAVREIAPDFDLALFDGGRFRLSEHRGRAVVINFFASWCVSCGEEASVFGRAAQKYAGQAVSFLAIAVDDTEPKAREFLKKSGMAIPAGLDRSGRIKDAYGIYGMPTTFVIDRAGTVSYLHAGVVTEQLLAHELGKVL